MSHNRNITCNQDRVKVDVNDASEVETLHQYFSELSHARVLDAIREAGPERKRLKNTWRKSTGYN